MVSALLLGAKMILNPDQLTILAQAAPQTAPQNAPGIGGMLLPMVLMMVLFYFLLIRPQTKREKERKKMVEALKNGDSVVTRGGIVGSVQSVKNDTLTIRSLESKFEVYKDAVERVITDRGVLKVNKYLKTVKRNNLNRFLFLLLVLGWAWYEMTPLQDKPGRLLDRFTSESTNKVVVTEIAVTAQTNFLAQSESEKNEYGALMSAVVESGVALSDHFDYKFSGKKTTEEMNNLIMQKLQRDSSGQIQFGLDLQGGSSFLVEMQMNSTNRVEQEGALSQAVEVLRRRVDDEFSGVVEPDIRPMGEDKVMIQLPGLSAANQAKARQLVTQAAFLEFGLVHTNSMALIANGVTPPGYKKYTETRTDAQGIERTEELLVETQNQYGLRGEQIVNASPSRDPLTSNALILFSFNSEGGVAMGSLSGANVGRQMAIILDGQLMSAPVLQEQITSNGQITGDFTMQEAATIANALLNPLKAPLEIVEEMSVEPTLGADSVQSAVSYTHLTLPTKRIV